MSVCTGAATRPTCRAGRRTRTWSARWSASWRTRWRRPSGPAIAPDRLILDPGFGFAKTGEHNWELLQRLDELDRLGRPLLVGVSRKAFLGTLLADETGRPRPARQRDDATTALTFAVARHPVWGVRVHAVRPSRDAIAVAERLRLGRLLTAREPRRLADPRVDRLTITSSPVCWRGIGGA